MDWGLERGEMKTSQNFICFSCSLGKIEANLNHRATVSLRKDRCCSGCRL